jgi:ferredoxin
VKIPKQFHPLLPDRASDEAEGIARTWDEEFSEATSRLACLITLDKKHDGMVVYVPSAPPMDFC